MLSEEVGFPVGKHLLSLLSFSWRGMLFYEYCLGRSDPLPGNLPSYLPSSIAKKRATVQNGPAQFRAVQMSGAQICPLQIGPTKHCPTQIGSVQVSIPQVKFRQIKSLQIEFSEGCMAEPRTVKLRAGGFGITQVCTAQIRP